MGLLDEIPQPYKPPRMKWKKDGVFEDEQKLEELNNLGRDLTSEDYSDSPYYKK